MGACVTLAYSVRRLRLRARTQRPPRPRVPALGRRGHAGADLGLTRPRTAPEAPPAGRAAPASAGALDPLRAKFGRACRRTRPPKSQIRQSLSQNSQNPAGRPASGYTLKLSWFWSTSLFASWYGMKGVVEGDVQIDRSGATQRARRSAQIAGSVRAAEPRQGVVLCAPSRH
jgi:hypothetical protein